LVSTKVAACGVTVEHAEDIELEALGHVYEQKVPVAAALVQETNAIVMENEPVS
jgi:hypothetical protein